MSAADHSTTLTAGEIWRQRERLEADAALLLGRFLFGFSRLEFSVLLLVQSLRREKWIPSSTNTNLHAYSEAIRKFAQTTVELPIAGRNAYLDWLGELDSLRDLRNTMVHGRWLTDGSGTKIMNVIADPHGDRQYTTEYTLSEFQALVERPASLQVQLSKLRTKWQT